MSFSSLRSLAFIFIVVGIFYCFSHRKNQINLKFVFAALSIQFFAGLLFLKIPQLTTFFSFLNKGVLLLESVCLKATQFMFGYLAGGTAPFEVANANANFIVAFRVLPLILFISALSSMLIYLKVLPLIVEIYAKVLGRFLKLSGPVSFASSATLFFGTIEAPLLIKNKIKKMSNSDLLAVISCSMATIAGTVMVLYATVLQGVMDNPARHMLTASIMSVPAALMLSYLINPLKEENEQEEQKIVSQDSSLFESLISGTVEGLQMVLHIAAIIIVLFATIYLFDETLALIGVPYSTTDVLATLLRPIMWMAGIEWGESWTASQLMSSKILLNEYVAFLQLSQQATDISESSRLILTYSLCGFANLASVGIVLGGLGAIVPERKKDLSRLAIQALVIGNFATLMTAAVANILV